VSKPNVLLIINDSARLDRCSCYGYGPPTTPVLDEVAAEGVRFERCYSESTWTVPVMFTLLTGLAPREHRGEELRRLAEGLPSLPELLKRAGYSTFAGSANPFFGPKCHVTRGFDEFYRPARAIRITKPFVKYIAQRLGWTDNGGAVVTKRFCRALPSLKPPWFAVLWYFDAHSPYAGKQPFIDRFATKPLSLGERNGLLKRLRRPPELGATASEEDIPHLSDLFDAAMAYEDMLIGRVREALVHSGAWNDTLTVITADHGEMLGEGGLMGHGRPVGMHEPLVHVPLVARGPDVEAGTVSDSLVQMADIAQTIARAAGVAHELPPTAAERLDLREAATGPGRSHAISEREPFRDDSIAAFGKRNPSYDVSPFLSDMASVVRDGWKLVEGSDGTRELYEVGDDPDEADDLASGHPGIVEELAGLLADWREQAKPHGSVEGLSGEDEAIVDKRLQDFGYF